MSTPTTAPGRHRLAGSPAGPPPDPAEPATRPLDRAAPAARPAAPPPGTDSPPAADAPPVAELARLSGGTVVAVDATGPTLAGRRPRRRRRTRPDLFEPALPRGHRRAVTALTLAWCAGLVLFWQWWLQPAHRTSWAGLVVNSALLAYLSLLPVYFLGTANRVRRVSRAVTVPALRVAFVVTKAPSEPWPVARRTLAAMRAQRFPHPYDVWLCDEDPSEETAAWCRARGIGLSTRRGVPGYHRSSWPRRTRCKEGNLAYFYDLHGYRDYDVVAQLDCDHVPGPDYLAEVVRPFADPAVGYVCAPSVCDIGSRGSWSARGRLHREAPFHGAVQAGHGSELAPVCIGSHYAVRTAALAEIGGLGPELAEDFSTTFLLNSAGWCGVFALDAEAHGDGPLTFAAMVTQEFQWSRSLTTLLLGLVPRHLGRLRPALRLRFCYVLVFYALLATTTLAGLMLPPIAAVTGHPWVRVNYLEFLGHWWLLSVLLLAVVLLLRRRGLLRPTRAPVISWENWLYALTRWPYVAWGVTAALVQWLRPTPLTFRVTPKARDGLERLPLRLTVPYLAIATGLAGAALVGEARTSAVGYVGLCLLGAVVYGVVALAVPVLHGIESARVAGVPAARGIRATAGAPTLLAVAVLAATAFPVTLFPLYLSYVLAG